MLNTSLLAASTFFFQVLKSSALLAPLEGGYDINSRRAFAEEISKYDVFGYVLDGLHTNGPEVENIKFISVESVVTECLVRRSENVKMKCLNTSLLKMLVSNVYCVKHRLTFQMTN